MRRSGWEAAGCSGADGCKLPLRHRRRAYTMHHLPAPMQCIIVYLLAPSVIHVSGSLAPAARPAAALAIAGQLPLPSPVPLPLPPPCCGRTMPASDTTLHACTSASVHLCTLMHAVCSEPIPIPAGLPGVPSRRRHVLVRSPQL